MIRSYEDWRAAVDLWSPDAELSAHPDFGRHYPWRYVARHAASRDFARTLRMGEHRVEAAIDAGHTEGFAWCASIGGKDSRACAILAHRCDMNTELMSVIDDLCYPGEEEQFAGLGRQLGYRANLVRPRSSLRREILTRRLRLTGDIHSRHSAISKHAFYGPLLDFQAVTNFGGMIWGLRSRESRGRRRFIRRHGALSDHGGHTLLQPIHDWTSLDVHALLALADVPIPIPYLCVGEADNPFAMRTTWWFAGLPGSLRWLALWWPELYNLALDLDPRLVPYGDRYARSDRTGGVRPRAVELEWPA